MREVAESCGIRKTNPHTLRSGKFCRKVVEEFRAKYPTPEISARAVEQTAFAAWPQIREEIRQQLIPAAAVKIDAAKRSALQLNRSKSELPRTRLRDSFVQAWYIRRRFTVLDVIYQTQLADQCLEHLFGANGALARMNPQTGTYDYCTITWVNNEFRYWQRRILITSLVGYAFFYLVRKNISFAMPGIKAQLGLTKADLGLFLTLHGVVYGLSKFLNGFVADRVNARWYMVIGLVLSAAMNICFGFGSAAVTLGRFLGAQWLVPRDGFSTVCAINDALVFAKTTRNKNVDLEHVAFVRRRGGGDFCRVSRGLRMALYVFGCPVDWRS